MILFTVLMFAERWQVRPLSKIVHQSGVQHTSFVTISLVLFVSCGCTES